MTSAWRGYEVTEPPMTGEAVELIREKLFRKYQWARDLGVTEGDVYDEVTATAIAEFQARAGLPVLLDDNGFGIADYATRVRLGAWPPPAPILPTLYTVHGTGMPDPLGPGLPNFVAWELLDVWDHQPIGNYPAAPTGMARSVAAGRAELVAQILSRPGKIGLVGYSQGAMVIAVVWLHDILNPNGVLHHRINDVIAAVTWGNPYREQGVANGNKAAGWPIPEGRGISDERLVDTPPWWYDYAHGANSPWGRDIYTDTPDDHAGEHMTAIYRLVQSIKGVVGRDGLGEQIFEVVTRPIREGWAAARAIGYGIRFIARRPPTLPHINYDIRPAIDYLRAVAVDATRDDDAA